MPVIWEGITFLFFLSISPSCVKSERKTKQIVFCINNFTISYKMKFKFRPHTLSRDAARVHFSTEFFFRSSKNDDGTAAVKDNSS